MMRRDEEERGMTVFLKTLAMTSMDIKFSSVETVVSSLAVSQCFTISLPKGLLFD